MFSLSIFKRTSPVLSGPGQALSAGMKVLPSAPATDKSSVSAPPSTTADGSVPPAPGAGELHITESLDHFHTLVRRHRADRIYLDLLELAPAGSPAEKPGYCVLLSASRSGTDMLARLTYRGEKDAGRANSHKAAQTYLNVLRSRFLFLGYSTSDGLASARLARDLLSPPEIPPAA